MEGRQKHVDGDITTDFIGGPYGRGVSSHTSILGENVRRGALVQRKLRPL